jgi:NADPH-dependent 2,4-dienoyl-CoA reductase/sulfur reductase-like enzyme
MAGAVSVNGVKRRAGAGLGRCQGGYCLQNVIEIIADELDVPVASVRLEEADSRILYDAPNAACARCDEGEKERPLGDLSRCVDVAVLGSGPAGLSAAVAAAKAGARRVIVVERLSEPGGLLPQCVHRGFGMRVFGEELTGPEYAARLTIAARASGAEFLTDCAVTMVHAPEGGGPVALDIRSRSLGAGIINAGALVFAAGCRERPLGHLPVTGERPAGIFTAGAAQRLMNIGQYVIGSRAVVLGSGDVGLIMARQMKLAGMEVACVLEREEVCGGLPRNKRECLDDFGIPLLTGRTVTRVFGQGRVSAVEAVSVLGEPKPELIECDTLIVSVGLIPERDLLHGLPESGNIILCGNANTILRFADDIADDGAMAGREAARLAMNPKRVDLQ